MRKIIGVWLGLEVILAWLVCHWLSVGTLLLSWLLAVITGSYLLRGLGAHLRQMQQAHQLGQGLTLSGPIARVLAAILFIIPGTLSDLFALLLLIPATQTHLARRFAGSAAGSRGGVAPGGRVIEGEFAEEIDKNRLIGPGQ